jgi:diguanylate cyclase (GGDEF)-like protein
MTGVELMARIKTVSPDTVRILITGNADMETTVRAINEGEIHRFIQKPWNRSDLLQHVSLAVQRHLDTRQRRSLAESLVARNFELAGLNDALRQVAQRDPLTGLFNRGEFDLQLERQLKLFRRDRQPCSLLMGDIDDFKRINDTCGHPVGDQVIRAAGQALLQTLREEVDSVFRYGGEEFAVILRNTPCAAAMVACERILAAVRASLALAGRAPSRFTMSFGLGQCRPDESAATLLERVDAALYRAKRAGKDRVYVEEAGLNRLPAQTP